MKELDHLVLGLDLGAASRDAAREARVLARAYGAQIHLVHAIPAAEYSPEFDRASALAIAEMQAQREAVQDAVDVAEAVAVRSGDSVEILRQVIGEVGAGLIVLGAGERSAVGRVLLGSTAERVTREAPVPVWLTHPGGVELDVRKVLCAVDPGPESAPLLSAAGGLAARFQAELILFSVEPAADAAELRERREARTRALLADPALQGVKAEAIVGCGKPAVEILDTVQRLEPDVLVIGSAGRKGVARLLRGNTAEKLLRIVPCSTLTVPQAPAPA